MIFAKYPQTRMRRNRSSEFSRKITREVELRPHNLIYPIFVSDNSRLQEKIETMPDCYRLGIKDVLNKAGECYDLGISAIALFPCIEEHLKSKGGDESYNPKGLIPRMIKELKKYYPELFIKR